jgi:hypothetical protein
MKVVSVSSNDWANFAYQFSQSLKAVGVESYSYCLASHPFGYSEQSEVVDISQLRELTKDADFIVVHHSCNELLPHISPRKIIHYAAGTKYRQDHQRLNEAFKGATTFIALPEFQDLVEGHYVVGAIDTDKICPSVRTNTTPLFGHFPSNPSVKGTNTILKVLNEAGVQYRYSGDKVDHQTQLDRMSACDVYVELLAPEQGGKPYGSFGMTALEAAALGKIVITQNNSDKGLYGETYGFNGLNFAKDEQTLKKHIQTLNNYQGDYLLGQQKVTRDWVVNNHSFKATGERVVKILNGL